MKHVLIVDDSQPFRERLSALLAESGRIRIVGLAADTREALDMLQQKQPDTVILDIRLSGGSGLELLKTIKARFPQVAVIMLTNYDYPHYRRHCRRLGADYFLNKSRDFDKIADAVTGRAGD